MSALAAAAWLGASGVALGAFGAHALSKRADARSQQVFETGVRYQLLHALALLALAAWVRTSVADPGPTQTCWTLGTLLFSGSLYGLALGGPRWLAFLTPPGGLGLIAGWLLLLPLVGS